MVFTLLHSILLSLLVYLTKIDGLRVSDKIINCNTNSSKLISPIKAHSTKQQ